MYDMIYRRDQCFFDKSTREQEVNIELNRIAFENTRYFK